MFIFFVLICVVRLILQLPILNIYNKCQDVNLTSPVYFIHGGKCHTVPNQKIDVNAVMSNLFVFDSRCDILEGALIYRVQRRWHIEPDELRGTELLVTWHVDHAEESHVRALLIEHNEELDWNEDKLRVLHQKCWQPLDAWVDPIGNNWLLHNLPVLATSVKIMNGGYRWDISISEGMEDNVKRPLWIDAER
jgi:hypothetical protein